MSRSTIGGWKGPKIVRDGTLQVYIDPSSPNCYPDKLGSFVGNMGSHTLRNYTVTYYTGSLSSASYNSQANTFDYRFRVAGGGGSRITNDFTIQQVIYYPTGSPNTTYPYDMIFTTQVGSGTGIGIFLNQINNQIWLVLAGGTRLTLTNVPKDQWFDLAFTKEGTLLKGYVNGVLTGTASYGAYTNYDAIFWGSNGGSLALQNYFIRAVSLLIYNRALSDVEIQQNKTALGARVGL
jgi:hypothetical protein